MVQWRSIGQNWFIFGWINVLKKQEVFAGSKGRVLEIRELLGKVQISDQMFKKLTIHGVVRN